MRIAEIIGTVALNQAQPSFRGAQLKLVVPLTLENLTGQTPRSNELIVVYDELGAGHGHQIAISEGGEAAQPFLPDLVPVDAYNAAILDHVDVVPVATALEND